MTENPQNIVFLEIENNLIKCNKNDLTEHSDYFKAMLEGNFVEKDLHQIKIEGVQVKAVNIILILLWDETYLIDEQDILSVLQAACMLQFDKVRNSCLQRVNDILRLDNCIKIWVVTEELSLKPICSKAKLLALQEFMEIRDSESVLELNLEQILDYLGNIYLKTDSELTVFQTSMKWWYEHSEYFMGNVTDLLLKLLSCVDFKNLDENSFNEIMVYPDISNNKIIIEILEVVRKLKKKDLLTEVTASIQEKAQLLYDTKTRSSPFYVAILCNEVPLHHEGRKSTSLIQEQFGIIHYDKFKRKRVLCNLLSTKPENVVAVYYDEELKAFKSLFVIDQSKCENLEGYKIVGYKEYVFLFGGQYLIGKGEWNVNFWVYDTVKASWERKTRLPYCRRHFETCVVGNNVFIAGGIGNYRIIQENSFFYDYKKKLWSRIRALSQMKCCDFLNKCFFLSMVEKCGYFWKIDDTTEDIIKVNIISDELILKQQSEFGIFSFKDKFFIKGKHLIEFEMQDGMLIMTSVLPVTNLDCDKLELVAFDGIVYTFYKFKKDDGNVGYSLERLNLLTKRIDFIFKDLSDNDQVSRNVDKMFQINSQLKIFTISHYNIVERSVVINTSFRNIPNKDHNK